MAAPAETDDLTAALEALLRGRAVAGPLGVAVSGGGDSTSLLLATCDRATRLGVPLHAATVDHGLRPEAAAEARQVAALCDRLGVIHETLVLTDLHDGPGLQARARTARYAALAKWASGRGIGAVLLGHTADDVAETMLMRLSRGVGLDGLAAMAPWRRVDGIEFARPFLHLTRDALRADLARRGVSPVEDPSNDDLRFERVRIRQAMAALALDPKRLARSAAHLADVRTAMAIGVETLAGALVHEDRGDLIILRRDVISLRTQAPEFLRRLMLAALGFVGNAPVPRSAEMARLLDAAPDLAAPVTLAGCLVSPLAGPLPGLRIAREVAACTPPSPLEGEITDWDGRWRIRGPALQGATVGALDGNLGETPWRGTGLPAASLRASPAVRDASGALVCAPLAGLSGRHAVELSQQFPATLRRRNGVFD